jgi:hypothetical protein
MKKLICSYINMTLHFPLWWKYEAGTTDNALFEFLCRSNNIEASFKQAKIKLFETKLEKAGCSGRKRFVYQILQRILNIGKNNGKEFIKLYTESYGEKENFMKYLCGSFKCSSSSPSLQLKFIERASGRIQFFQSSLFRNIYLSKSIFPKISSGTTN